MRYVAHGYFAYVKEISFAYSEHLVHGGVAWRPLQTQKILVNLSLIINGKPLWYWHSYC